MTQPSVPAAALAQIPFHKTPISEEDVDAVAQVLRSGWLATGPQTTAFEQEFAGHLGVAHAVAVNSGTAALHLALEAIGVREGDDVIVPTLTFTSSAAVVRHLGARPVLADVDEASLTLPADEVQRRWTPQCKAVIPVHMAGVSCDMPGLMATAHARGALVVEDAAHALPTWCGSKPAGTYGDAAAFSFYATKTITTGEGGMIVTADSAVAQRARQMAFHGITRNAFGRYQSPGRWYYEVDDFGFKYNLTDVAAALGRSQLRRVDELWKARRAIAQMLDAGLSIVPEVQIPYRHGGANDSWHLYIMRLHVERLTCSRDEFIDELGHLGIGTSVHFIPLHLHPVYRKELGYRVGDFPVAEREYARMISLPIWPGMSRDDITRVVDAVAQVARTHRR
jgi:dTDP-4-amino-4,6-dideoxygalactose transaminase